MAIELSSDIKQALVYAIKQYFLDEREEELGDLQSMFLLEFIMSEIGPYIYNRAIRDVQEHLHGSIANLDVTLYAPEGARRGRSRDA